MNDAEQAYPWCKEVLLEVGWPEEEIDAAMEDLRFRSRVIAKRVEVEGYGFVLEYIQKQLDTL